MPATLGFAMIAAFLALIMTKKMSPVAALVLIPALFCVLVGQGAHLGDYVLKGIGDLAPTAAMLMFAMPAGPAAPSRVHSGAGAHRARPAPSAIVWPRPRAGSVDQLSPVG